MLNKIVKNDSSLKSAFTAFSNFKANFPLIELHPDFVEYKLFPEQGEVPNSYEHEAGYDALMTGFNFLKSAALL